MKGFTQLKIKGKLLKQELTALYYVYRHPDLGLLPKMAIALTLGYALSPIDLIPDFIPILGYLDDLLIIPLLIALSIRLIPPDLMAECRLRATDQPPRLKRNWLTGGIFIAVWICLLSVMIMALIKLFRHKAV